jgi:hypothetical protein
MKEKRFGFGGCMAEIVMSFVLMLVLGTIAGAWIKLYWLGWVMNGVPK